MYNDEDEFDDGDFIFNEYTIDDSLDSLSRLEKYYNSDFSLQRLVLVRDIFDTAREAGHEEAEKRLLPLLTHFVSDTEPVVRQVFADQLHQLALFFLYNNKLDTIEKKQQTHKLPQHTIPNSVDEHNDSSNQSSTNSGELEDPFDNLQREESAMNDNGYNELINTFIPYAFELIIDKSAEVGQSATEALNKIAQHIKQDHIDPQLLSVIVNLAHDERVEEYRIAAAKLFNELASVFGKDLCTNVVVQEIISLSEDPSLLVRKTVAQNLGNICLEIGVEETDNKLIPVFLALSKDEIWGVRKACAESLPKVSQCCSQQVREKQLVGLFERFAEDMSRWVKMESYKQLGAFIVSFKDHVGAVIDEQQQQQEVNVPESLLKYFADMAFVNDHDAQNESDLVEYCAYNFPAVVYTCGAAKFTSMLEKAYEHLVKDVQWKVRRSLACSLHEISRIVGREVSERVLCPAFELFLRDLDEVKIGVISNVAIFLQNLSLSKRESYVPTICSLPEQTDNWRIRARVSEQLGQIAMLVSVGCVKQVICKVAQEFFDDPYACVRKQAVISAGLLMKRLLPPVTPSTTTTNNNNNNNSQEEYYRTDDEVERREAYEEFLAFLHGMARGAHHRRLAFIFACTTLYREIPSDVFIAQFVPELTTLARDKVPNIRLAVARFLRDEKLFDKEWAHDIVAALIEDGDKDVTSIVAVLNK
jgi:serine/threonine-protein phosphatase 4 regulatory subunit 1